MLYAKSLVKLMLIVVILDSAIISLSAQDIKGGLFKEADQAMQEATRAQAELLAPKNFKKAVAYYNEAESDFKKEKNLDDIRKKLRAAITYFQKAAQATKLAEVTFQNLMKMRSDALNANALDFATNSLQEAESKFAEAAEALENGDVNKAKKIGGEAEALYRKAELEAIKASYLNETWALLEQADKVDVKDRAPKTLQLAEDLANKAEKELNENRYDTDYPRSLAIQAKYEVKHAIYLASTVKKLKDSGYDFEDLLLMPEKPMQKIAAAVDINAEFDQGFDRPAQQIIDSIVTLQDLRQSLADRDQQISTLQQRISELESKVGAYAQEQTQLKKSLEEQEKIRQQFISVGKTFTREEASVLRDENDVIIRLVGLNFDVSKSEIKPEYFSLLTKVQNAINTFPQCKVTVEGNTDSYGGDNLNLKLSQERADAVRAYLMANMGLDPSRIEAVGYGETKPIANNETAEGRAKNRRIDIVIHPELMAAK